tara:strand:- start:9975 stop:10787 length:813 start_codon:yes stop_codon:yes gene_type:complete
MFKKLEIKPIHFISVILVLIILLMFQCNRTTKIKAINTGLENKVERIEGNIIASQDTIKYYKNKNDFYVSEISAYEFTAKELKDKADDLYEKYENALGDIKKLKNVNQLLSAEINIKEIDTVYAVIENDSILYFNDSTDYGDGNWRKWNSKISLFEKDNRLTGALNSFSYEQGIKLYSSIQEVDGIKKINIATKYPGLTFNNIEGISVIEDEINKAEAEHRSRVALGMGVGYGLTFTTGNMVYHGPQVGLFLTYTIKMPKLKLFNFKRDK